MQNQDHTAQTETTQIERTGQPPLRFKPSNEWLSSNRTVSGGNSNRWTTVVIYKTKGGKYVARISSYTIWEGESDYHKAESFGTPTEVIDYLRNDEGHLGRVSQDAIKSACEEDPAFAAAYVVDVE